MYLSWMEGNADTPIHLYILYFVRAIVMVITFPFLYDIFVNIFTDLSTQIINSLNVVSQENLTKNLATISSIGLATAVTGVIMLIMLILLYIQMLM